MKKVLLLALFLCAAPSFAQTQTQMVCRDLKESGGFLYPGETVLNGQACRQVTYAPAQSSAPPQVQQSATPPASTSTQPAPTTSNQSLAPAQQAPLNAPVSKGQPRVFLQSASHGNTWNARRDQSMEMGKDFEKVCQGVRVTINQQAADYTVLLNHIEVGLFARDNQMQVADKNGDLLETKEGGGIKGGVKKVCELILADWARQ